MNLDALIDDLIRDEGVVLKPYKCTAGKTTIGIGRNLDDVGITAAEARMLAFHDIDRVEAELTRNIPWIFDKPEPVQRAVANMCFNMGWPRLSGFKKMLAALEAEDYEKAAAEALNSRWASQVGERAQRIAKLIREA